MIKSWGGAKGVDVFVCVCEGGKKKQQIFKNFST